MNFSKPQEITSLIIYFGEWKDDTSSYTAQPSDFRLEFSDGTAIDVEDEQELPEYISFGKTIITQSVKITITDITGVSGRGVYVSEIKPF